jgi:hypothetical protein
MMPTLNIVTAQTVRAERAQLQMPAAGKEQP